MYTILLVVQTIVVLFLIVMVLLQRTDADGLGGLGGGGGNQFMTGRAAANFMTRTTAWLAAIFMATSLILAVMANHMGGGSVLDATPAPVVDTTLPDTAKEAAPAKPASPAVPKPE